MFEAEAYALAHLLSAVLLVVPESDVQHLRLGTVRLLVFMKMNSDIHIFLVYYGDIHHSIEEGVPVVLIKLHTLSKFAGLEARLVAMPSLEGWPQLPGVGDVRLL